MSRVSYESLKSLDHATHPFGVPIGDWCFAHPQEDGSYAVSYLGGRLLEVHPDNTTYVYLPKKNMTSGLSNRWTWLLGAHSFNTQKRSRSNGITEYEITSYKREQKAGQRYASSAPVSSVRATHRFKVNQTTLELYDADDSKQVAVKDNVKYRAFNTRLKALRAVTLTQMKMGTYDQYSVGYQGTRDKLQAIFGKNYVSSVEVANMIYTCAKKFVEQNDMTVIPDLVVCCFYNHSSNVSHNTIEDKMRRVNNGLKAVQARYLREHCVTIVSSNNSLSPNDEHADSEDQQSQLLPNDGLREVQVPSEAEVC